MRLYEHGGMVEESDGLVSLLSLSSSPAARLKFISGLLVSYCHTVYFPLGPVVA